MQLFSEECLIMNFRGNISSQSNSIIKEYQAEDFLMNLNYSLQKDDKQIDENIAIKMLTKDDKEFNKQMDQIVRNLELDQYSNNKIEHLDNLNKFLTKHYPNIKIKEVEKLPQSVKFSMKYENKDLVGLFTYLDPSGKDLGKYNVKFFAPDESTVIKEFDFKRQYINSLYNTFTEQGVDKLFRQLYEEILEIFEEEYASILKEAVNEDLKASTSNSLMGK